MSVCQFCGHQGQFCLAESPKYHRFCTCKRNHKSDHVACGKGRHQLELWPKKARKQ